MIKVAYQSQVEPSQRSVPAPVPTPHAPQSPWRDGLPFLTGARVTLRELRVSDAPALVAALSNELVSRFMSPPPPTVDGFKAFIRCAARQRQAGHYACFAIVPHGSNSPVGVFQVRSLEASFATAEWGFAIAPEYWGTGVFGDGARLLISFAFEVLGVHRLEARAAVKNERGNAALRRVGAVMEGVLRRSFQKNGEYLDQALWTIVRDEWPAAGHPASPATILH
jgi:RimJ/RimL family protein N-acetyltransferase